MDEVFEILQSLRKCEVLCDIMLKTNDGTIVFGHKVVLVSASPYFHEMFISRDGCHNEVVNIRELDSTVLQHLINYIYTGEILVTKENVKVILAAANLLQLSYVKNACAEFLQSQMDPSNCLSIKAFANLHNCMELFSSSEEYIKKQFLEVVKYNEFLSLSSVEVIKLISCNDIFVPIEEKVGGYDGFNGLKSAEVFDISIQEWRMISNMSCKRTLVGVGVLDNLLYAVGGYDTSSMQRLKTVECYDPNIDTWTLVAELSICRSGVGISVLDGVMYAIGGFDGLIVHKSVETYTTSSKAWTTIADMHFCRYSPAVVALDGLLYVMGGRNLDSTHIDSVEIYNPNTNTWKLMESSINFIGLTKIKAGVVINGPPYFRTNQYKQ
ncbi:hypothetical protein ACI65C_006289 [Semiaphis heraclei]